MRRVQGNDHVHLLLSSDILRRCHFSCDLCVNEPVSWVHARRAANLIMHCKDVVGDIVRNVFSRRDVLQLEDRLCYRNLRRRRQGGAALRFPRRGRTFSSTVMFS